MKKLLLFFISTVFTLTLSAQCVPSVVHEASVTFSTLPPGAISGLFSVSATKQVYFSMGNLQYQGSTGTWRFAEHQYDMIGNNSGNTSPSSSQTAWQDLFCYGTSGYNNQYPYKNIDDNASYYGSDISGTNYDWGVYNAISNGGNQAGLWRTPTNAEWTYLFQTRTNAASKYAKATVNGVNGVILLPDTWTLPSGCSYSSGMSASNSYNIDAWTKMETAGAVFFPLSGWFYGSSSSSNSTTNVTLDIADYTSSTKSTDNTRRYAVQMESSSVSLNYAIQLRTGAAVRLIKDAN